MPPFIALLLKLLPYLPTIVRTVEAIHGGPASTGQGAKKLETAISLVQTVVPAVVTHLQDQQAGGENTNNLKGLIGTVVAGINAAKTWRELSSADDSPFPK